MFSKAPINERDDVIGALSLVLYTIILVPLVKYVLVVLLANDDGEGMLSVVNKAHALSSVSDASINVSMCAFCTRRNYLVCFNAAGGTFALYSLICRHAKVSLLPNQLPSDARISSFRLKVPSAELERSLKIKERLENSLTLKKILLMLVLAGTAMVIADGAITPAMSGFDRRCFSCFLLSSVDLIFTS